jgi:hypothetical protein
LDQEFNGGGPRHLASPAATVGASLCGGDAFDCLMTSLAERTLVHDGYNRSSPLAPDVSIVIVSWNVRELLRDCLRSIEDQTRRPYEVIVVDNDSRDRSAEMVRAEFPEVTLIANRDNRGFAAANNQGLASRPGATCCCSIPTRWCSTARSTRCSNGWSATQTSVAPAVRSSSPRPTSSRPVFRHPGPLNLLLVETGAHRSCPACPIFVGRPPLLRLGSLRRARRRCRLGMFMLLPRRVLERSARWTTLLHLLRRGRLVPADT